MMGIVNDDNRRQSTHNKQIEKRADGGQHDKVAVDNASGQRKRQHSNREGGDDGEAIENRESKILRNKVHKRE